MSLPTQPVARILIVEDNELDALLLQEALKKAAGIPIELIVAVYVRDAIALLKQSHFDVILSDLSLPDSSGFTTFARLYEHAQGTPVILLTGLEDEALGLEAIRAGAQEYVVKGTMNEKALWRVISYAIERSTLERTVRDSEKRYKRLLGSVTDYLYTVKIAEGRIASISHNEACVGVTGYTSQEMENDPELGQKMLPVEDRAAVVDQGVQAIAGHAQTLEHRLLHKDCSIRWVRHTTVLRQDEQGRVIGYDGLISNITERKQAEEALRKVVQDLQKSREELKSAHLQLIQAEKMETVGRMAAGVAHEVQNPLQILLMNLDYLSQTSAPIEDPVIGGVICDMREAAGRAERIIRGLLEFSHSDALTFKAQPLNPLIESALLLVRHKIATSHIPWCWDLSPDCRRFPSMASKSSRCCSISS